MIEVRWGALGHPDRPKALIRFWLRATLTSPDGGVRRVKRALLLDAGQMIAPLLRRFSEPGTWTWLIPASVAAREHARGGPGSFHDTASRCLLIGISQGEPVRGIDVALAHASEPWGR